MSQNALKMLCENFAKDVSMHRMMQWLARQRDNSHDGVAENVFETIAKHFPRAVIKFFHQQKSSPCLIFFHDEIRHRGEIFK